MMKNKLMIAATAAVLVLPAILSVCCQGGRKLGPCDIYDREGTPCVAAHSTTRRLYSRYDGPLYQIQRESDGEKLDITQTSDGYADVNLQRGFCSGTTCFITVIYDQSGRGNDLKQAAPGTFKGPAKGEFNTMAIADMAPVLVNGHEAYGLYIMPGMGYRNNNASYLAIDDEPEGIYYVIDGTHFDSGCCFDYGNSSTNGKAVGRGTMETTYYGTATAWGSGNGEGPWIMADMEAGLFSGFSAKKNDVPSITDWRFVSVFVNGGGGNRWDLRGGDATTDSLTTFYSGERPHVEGNDNYYPMHRKGAILLGNGGDNGNGSAGTFYEGVMTQGYPTDNAIALVQKNIAAQKYRAYPLTLSRVRSFAPGSGQTVTATFTNVTDSPMDSVGFTAMIPSDWLVEYPDATIGGGLEPGESMTWRFTLISPDNSGGTFSNADNLQVLAKTSNGSYEVTAKLRSASPVKINELRLAGAPQRQNDQFIELYNPTETAIDLSGWKLRVQRSGWAPVDVLTLPAGTEIAANGFLLVGTAGNYAALGAGAGSTAIYLGQDAASGQVLRIGGSDYTVSKVGTPAGQLTTVFIPVSTGPWLEIPAGSTNVPVTSNSGFEAGQLMGIGLGDRFESVTVTQVGTAATQTVLAAAVAVGDTRIELESNDRLQPGDEITIGTGQRKELAVVKSIERVASAPQGRRAPGTQPRETGIVELEKPLAQAQMSGVDVSCPGTGISFTPALRYAHESGDAVQSLGLPYELDRPLEKAVEMLDAVCDGSQGFSQEADAWIGYALSAQAGMVALYTPTGVLADAIVYGSQQSSSSANGTIAQPQIAVLEGDQDGGGCIAVVPRPQNQGFGGFGGFGGRQRFSATPAAGNTAGRSLVRIPDGTDSDNLCVDFRASDNPTPGEANKE